MPSWKNTFPGSGMRKWATTTKGHQHKEYLFIPKICARLLDLLVTEHSALPAWKYWHQKKDPRLNVKPWNQWQEKLLLFSNHSVQDPKTNVYPRQMSPQLLHNSSHSILTWSLRYGFSKYRALLSWKKLCYNGKNFLTWYNTSFQLPIFVSYCLHKPHQILWTCPPTDIREK